MLTRQWLAICLILSFVLVGNSRADETAIAGDAGVDKQALSAPVWLDSYSEAMRKAKAEKKMLLIHFFRPGDQRRQEAPDAADSVVNIERCFSQRSVCESLGGFVLAKLPLDASITTGGKPQKLLDNPAFVELHKGPGIAVIDLAHEDAE
jgi:hypothetical protein